MTPEQIDALLAQAVAVARRGTTAKPNRVDRAIVAVAVAHGKRAALPVEETGRS